MGAFIRWIESERTEALLGKGIGGDEERSIRHVEDAFLGFGSGPRVCPGQVRPVRWMLTLLLSTAASYGKSAFMHGDDMSPPLFYYLWGA